MMTTPEGAAPYGPPSPPRGCTLPTRSDNPLGYPSAESTEKAARAIEITREAGYEPASSEEVREGLEAHGWRPRNRLLHVSPAQPSTDADLAALATPPRARLAGQLDAGEAEPFECTEPEFGPAHDASVVGCHALRYQDPLDPHANGMAEAAAGCARSRCASKKRSESEL